MSSGFMNLPQPVVNVTGFAAQYATFGAFPGSAANGALAVALDTGALYEYNSNTPGWQQIGPTPDNGANRGLSNLTSPTALNQDLLFGSDGVNSIGSNGANRPFAGYFSNQVAAGDVSGGTTGFAMTQQGLVAYTSLNSAFPAMSSNPDLADTLMWIFSFASSVQFLQLRSGLSNSLGLGELRFTAAGSVLGAGNGGGVNQFNLVWDEDGTGDIGKGLGYATATIQDLNYYSVLPGPDKNGWSIVYANDSVSGSEHVTVAGSTITVHIQSGVTTANAIQVLFGGPQSDNPPQAFYAVVNDSHGGSPQTAPASATVASGTGSALLRPNNIYAKSKVYAGSGIAVGNSASGSVLGTLSRKMEVFDASGSSLGFVPIYTTIS